MNEKPELVIIVSNGVIQEIVSNDPAFFEGIKVTVIDYDEGSEEGAVCVDQGGYFEMAGVYVRKVDKAAISVPLVLNEE